VPIGEDEAKRGHSPASLPGIPEAAPIDARLADYFWYVFFVLRGAPYTMMELRFGRIVHINAEDERVHVQWFDYASNTFLDSIADPRELFLTPLCDTLSLITLCGTIPVADMSGATAVKDDFDGYYVR
jgi:DNA (cytosine-5)-methyltransferase 1